MNFSTARDLAEQLLEESRQGLMSGRFELFCDGIGLPLHIDTFDGQREIRTTEELREMFDSVRHLLMQLGVTDLVRRCVEAEFTAPDMMHTTYETRMLQGNRLIRDPFPVHSIARRIDGRWKVVSSSYAITDQPEITRVLTGDTESNGRV